MTDTEDDRIVVDRIVKSFPQLGRRSPDLEVLAGVSFTVRSGEFVTIIGPSGCGKSTVFNMLAGLESPDSGSVGFRAADGENTASHCAYMPQKDLLFPWRTILDNTILGLRVQGVPKAAARRRARELFGVFGLSGFENARPSQLSGGMRQRAALLRTVVQERELLLLDEPFGALDSLTRTEMQSWLQQVWQRYRWMVLMITHDVREAVYLSDRVIVLSARPATVRHELRIDLPRPRELAIITAPEFVALEEELLTILHEESRRSLGNR
ncbi:ABC transporter ATP-binding protein [Nocardia alba]|uniref:ABC-type nitrate/sulfonate/bicarbonate transport system ATPase subunit n=1 Tax=Nocardia alba TaxID=225051 RepID=A0A4V2PB83_9NOCA|nr:ABC transporter ATP-binding protein [Nocardia alba]TCJ96415.1 ABC-type nitrate/sulfonate/bicarbonate transport system ATPase subunit [Nocardia alba]